MSSNSPLYIVGAVVVGVVSAAGFILVESLRRERKQHAMARDLARLDRELSGMRSELQQLATLQKQRAAERLRREKKRPKSTASTTSENFMSAADLESSDMEFYDVSDEDTVTENAPESPINNVPLTYEERLKIIDVKLNSTASEDISEGFDLVSNLLAQRVTSQEEEDPDLLWRLAKAHYKLATDSPDKDTKKSHLEQGLATCEKALELNSELGEAHKWCAILLGSLNDYKGTKDKIQSSYLFKNHLDKALKLKPDDPTLHHLLGRFTFEIAKLSWLERKAAATFFAKPPTGTYEEALSFLLQAERLYAKDWKENKLLIAKCHIGMQNLKDAVASLVQADAMPNELNKTIDAEVKTLLQTYNSYR